MIVADKPPLDEDLLMHFGVKGMKWGRRKVRDSTSQSPSSSRNTRLTTVKKVALGTALVGGAAASAYLLSRVGGVKTSQISKASLLEGEKLIQQAAQLRADAPLNAQRQMARAMQAKTNDLTVLASSARMQQMMREMENTPRVNLSSLPAVKRALNQPKRAWNF